MAYDGKKKSTQLEVLTVPAPNDLHILGDVSDNGRAKAITQANLELAIASSDNFINELTQNATFIENLTILAPSPLTTKGDIYGYSTEPIRVPVGANGQRPEADSTQPAGWKWSDVISGGGAGAGVGGDAGFFGDGSDGDVVISSNTTLTRDMFYDNLTVNTSIELKTDGFRIFVKNTLTNNGTIHNNGEDPSGTRAQGGGQGSTGGGGQGSDVSGSGTSMTNSLGGAGGDAGVGGNGPGTVLAPSEDEGGYRYIIPLVLGRTLDGTLITGGAGGGSAAAGAPDENKGGGGGGIVIIVAKNIINTSGTIQSNGGYGGDAGTVSPNESGGGGGGGGAVILVYASLSEGVEEASGGLGGNPLGSGVAGDPGDDGTVIKFSIGTQDGLSIVLTAGQDMTAGQPVGAANFTDDTVGLASNLQYTQAFGEGVSNFLVRQLATDKIVVLYTNGADLKVKVGTLNRATMQFTFGSAVTVSTDTPTAWHIHTLGDNKFAVQYNTTTDQDVISIVAATVSANTITLGTPATLFTAAADVTSSNFLKAVDHGTDAGFAIIVDSGGTQSGVAYTFSGTTATVGTPVSIDVNGGGGVGIGTQVFIAKVGTNKVAYNGYSRAQCATISGTTVTVGTAADFRANTTGGSNANLLSVSMTTDVYVCAILDVSNEEYYCATISGTTMSFGSVLSGLNAQRVFVKSATELWLFEDGLRLVTRSGNTLSGGTRILDGYTGVGVIVDMENGKFWDIGFSGSDIEFFVDGMSQNFIGIVQNNPSVGGDAIVLIKGTSDVFSGLIPGGRYGFSGANLIQDDTGPVRALSSTKILF